MAGRVADLAVQVHGGTGYMREVPVERIYRDVRLLRLYEGTSEIQRLIIGGGLVRAAKQALVMLPLEGVTVVAVEQAVAAPLATRHLADLGARVIKVERLDGGDLARGYDHVVHGTGAHFVWLNRGKDSIAVDLKSDEGRAVVKRLVLAGRRLRAEPGTGRGRSGWAWAPTSCAPSDPSSIVASLSGYGSGGPLEQRKAYDMLDPGRGRADLDHRHARGPGQDGDPHRRHRLGHVPARRPSLAALLRRYRTGDGATIEVSMLEATVEWMGHALYTQMHTGSQPARDGPEPQRDRAVRQVPDQRRRDPHRRAERQRLARARHPRARRARSSPTTRASPPTSHG